MCMMKIIFKHDDREEVVLENAATLEVNATGVVVGAMFEQLKTIPGAEVRSIDFLNGRVMVAKRAERN